MFWALRGGGAGSWGVIVSITMQTYPIFSASEHTAYISFNTSQQAADAMTIHAQHIFDLDNSRAGQYFWVYNLGDGESLLQMRTIFANVSGDDAQAAVAPFIADVETIGAQLVNQTVKTVLANDIVGASADDSVGEYLIFVSSLIPEAQYKNNPAAIGAAYKTLLDLGVAGYALEHLTELTELTKCL